jgi:hypothetical protein
MRSLMLPAPRERGLLICLQRNQCLSNYKFRILRIESPTCSEKISKWTNSQSSQTTNRNSARVRIRNLFKNLWLTRIKNAMQNFRGLLRKDPRRMFETNEIAISQN